MTTRANDRSDLSRFGARVGVIAGEGRLPLDVAEQLQEAGASPFIVLAGDEARTAPGLLGFDHAELPPERIAELVPLLKKNRVATVVMSGAITRRPNWRTFRPSMRLLTLVPTIARALVKGDDGLLRVLVRFLEENGFTVVGAHEIAPQLLAPLGPLTSAKPTAGDARDLQAALVAAQTIGAIDVGQAAVAIGGRAIALEGIEGTDGLLDRVAALRGHGRLANAKRGVLVKCAKPEQEMRADLPTIGPDTVLRAHKAGLAGIGVEAERSLVLDLPEVRKEADRLGLFVVGIE
ncbi:MAG: UDP-2,3-diacylglucosamine diphosphatase LpxI [Methylobacterium mesophilicum]|nr:UDP-2,3-diacylglucosamine diphosphatase LpxI [Methylobacterium mesophilicum]